MKRLFCEMDADASNVIVELVDFHPQQELFGKLSSKLNECKHRPFSNTFEFFGLLSNAEMGQPYDVKLSYNHKCVLVSDLKNKCIHIFDLKSRLLIKRVNFTDRVRYLSVEENYNERHGDALLVSVLASVQKYDLKELISYKAKKYEPCQHLWRSAKFEYPLGMTVKYGKDGNHVYLNDKSNVFELDAKNGQTIRYFESTFNFAIEWIKEDEFLVSTFDVVTRIRIPDALNESKPEFPPNFANFSGVAYNHASDSVIVSNADDNCICVYRRGKEIARFGSLGSHLDQLSHPHGLCLHRLTGELYVCDHRNSRVVIYR